MKQTRSGDCGFQCGFEAVPSGSPVRDGEADGPARRTAKVISKDRALVALFQQILAEPSGEKWVVRTSAPAECSDGDDLYLWDYTPSVPLPPWVVVGQPKHLFVMDREDVEQFRSQHGATESSILLRPVTAATLGAFVGFAAGLGSDLIPSSLAYCGECDEVLQCLLQANLKLQEYDHDRTNFLARAVHDFRAPLTALNGYCGLLLAGPLGPLTENQREVLQRMRNSAARMARLASGMLQLSAGQRAPQQPVFLPGDLRDCLDQALHEVAPTAAEKRVALGADLAEPGVRLYFDAGQIEQVLVNLLENACKFTPRGGTIEVTGGPVFWERRSDAARLGMPSDRRRTPSTEPNAYRVDVRDSGPAIPDNRLDLIFEEYTSYGGGKDRAGAGLGLAICKWIICQHQGKIWAENSPAGPVFSFNLPLKRSDKAPPANPTMDPMGEFDGSPEIVR